MGAYTGVLRAVLRPKPRLLVSEWADRYRRIPRGTSPEPGAWHTDRAPYVRGIMDAVCDPAIETVVAMMASQMGKTEALLNILGYFVDQDPAPILMVQPTIEALEAFSKERIEPSFRASPVLRGKLESGKDGRGGNRKSANTIRVKHFPGGYLALAGANAAAGLASRPIRVVLCDEVDRFPISAGVEGDPVKLARQRTSNFYNRKIVLVSTPTVDGLSKIQHEHEQGDQRRYEVPCPHCGALQVLVWSRLIYKDADGERDLERAHYLCEHCEGRIEERHKPAMLAAGEWIAQKPGGKVASFGDLSALYSPWVRWAELAEQWCKVQDDRDKRGLQEFVNLRLGQPWVEHQQVIAVEYLERRREYYDGEAPAGVLVLTAGVDVQDDRLELEVVGWGADRESWGVEYLVLMGDPSLPESWAALDAQLVRTWQTDDGRRLGLSCVCVDSGGHHTAEVYAYCRAREQRAVWAIKGRGGAGVPAVGKPARGNRMKAALFTLGVDDLKGTLMARIQTEHEGPGYCHWPRQADRGYDAAYFAGLVSERRIVVQRGGVRRMEWKKIHDRNEPLDCRVYATAALEILHPTLTNRANPGGPGVPRVTKPRRGRRVLSRGVR